MNYNKPTPGPWVAIRSNFRWHGDDPIFKDAIWHILPEYDYERLPICTVDKGDDHDEPTRAHGEMDAKLIAAAPELLGALRAIITATELHGADSVVFFEARNQALEAIAKAESRPADHAEVV